MAAPNKAEREKCWSSKDAFWNCMEKNNDNAVACAELRKVYEASCTKQWVYKPIHFSSPVMIKHLLSLAILAATPK